LSVEFAGKNAGSRTPPGNRGLSWNEVRKDWPANARHGTAPDKLGTSLAESASGEPKRRPRVADKSA
jgi:hypothetical protein